MPDLIFLDINMPVVNGWEFLVKLKSDDKYKRIPVIILTTSSDKTNKQIASDLGAISLFIIL
jgi:CheY-like chemotaxis protein